MEERVDDLVSLGYLGAEAQRVESALASTRAILKRIADAARAWNRLLGQPEDAAWRVNLDGDLMISPVRDDDHSERDRADDEFADPLLTLFVNFRWADDLSRGDVEVYARMGMDAGHEDGWWCKDISEDPCLAPERLNKLAIQLRFILKCVSFAQGFHATVADDCIETFSRLQIYSGHVLAGTKGLEMVDVDLWDFVTFVDGATVETVAAAAAYARKTGWDSEAVSEGLMNR